MKGNNLFNNKLALMALLLPVILLANAVSTHAAPLSALVLTEGRTYDQAHDTGYLDWSGPVQYVYMTHRDNTSLPANEGGTYCGSGCQEWVTRIGNGGVVSGSFDRNVTYFEVMVGFTHDSSVGSATVRACSAVGMANLYLGPGGGLPGFVSMTLTVPAGCRSWSLAASSGYVDFRSVDANYVVVPPTPTYTSTRTPTFIPSATRTPTLVPTSTYTQILTFTPTATGTATQTPTNTVTFTPTASVTTTPFPTFTLTETPTATTTLSQTPTNTVTFTPTPSVTMTPSSTLTMTEMSTATTVPSQTPAYTATFPSSPPRVFITERWWIWDKGDLKISPDTFPITSVKIMISDPHDRWPALILEFDPDSIPDSLSWDRRFENGILAPSGEYIVVARACDAYDLCGQDTGIIEIPFVAALMSTVTQTPTVTLTETPPSTFTPTPIKMPATLTPILIVPSPEILIEPIQLTKSIPFWQLLGVLGLLLVIASASVIDPRPAALDRLSCFVKLLSGQNNFSSNNDE